jgi:hypothetical protein
MRAGRPESAAWLTIATLGSIRRIAAVGRIAKRPEWPNRIDIWTGDSRRPLISHSASDEAAGRHPNRVDWVGRGLMRRDAVL